MLEWLQSIGDFFILIAEFIISFLRNVVEMVILIFKGYAYVVAVIVFLPVQYQIVFRALISVIVIRSIIKFGG